MKKYVLKVSILSVFVALMFFNFQIINRNDISDSSLESIPKITEAYGYIPIDNRYQTTIGCGSYRMEDWQVGCCIGFGQCSDNCNSTHYGCN